MLSEKLPIPPEPNSSRLLKEETKLILLSLILIATIIGNLVIDRVFTISKAGFTPSSLNDLPTDIPFQASTQSITLAPGESWNINFTGDPAFVPYLNGIPVEIRSWNCDLYNPANCTAKISINPWKTADGTTIRTFVNGVMTNQSPSAIPPYRIYYLEMKPAGINIPYSNPIGVAFIPGFTSTSQPTDAQVNLTMTQAINTYQTQNPLRTILGLNNTTIASVESNPNWNKDQKIDQIARLVCGDSKVPLYDKISPIYTFETWQNDMAKWRQCHLATYHMLAMHYVWLAMQNPTQEYKNNITAYIYHLFNSFDISLTQKGQVPLSGISYRPEYYKYPDGTFGANMSLVSAPFAKEYITDVGMGVLKSAGWANQLNLLNPTYCSFLEVGATSTQCVTVNLPERIKAISKKLYDKERSEYYANDPWTTGYRRSRHLAGMAMAAKLNSDLFPDEAMFIKLAMETAAANLDTLTTLDYTYTRIQSDLFQHQDTLLLVDDWRAQPLTSPFIAQDRSHKTISAFRSSYWFQNQPIFRTDIDSYNESVLSQNPTDASQIGACRTTGKFWHRTIPSTGRPVKLLGLRGETPIDAVGTSIPVVKALAQVANPFLIPELNQTMISVFNAAKNQSINYTELLCDPSTEYGTMVKTPLSTFIRRNQYMIHSYFFWNQILIKSF